MLDHISLQVADLDASAAFYEAVLPAIGGGRIMSYGDQIGYGVGQQPTFWIGRAGAAGHHTDVHVAFSAPDRASVQAWFEAAVAAGAEVLHEPRVWPEYHPNYYGAFVRDPDGNNVEAVCHRPEP
jgi:catechol 2,3-dioxygenase-like lactoylglutathione lyase family enzyme